MSLNKYDKPYIWSQSVRSVFISWDFGILLYLWGIGVYNVRDKNTPKIAETILQIP
jgi:hypothetical protein